MFHTMYAFPLMHCDVSKNKILRKLMKIVQEKNPHQHPPRSTPELSQT